mgnify:CR=1 FL=1
MILTDKSILEEMDKGTIIIAPYERSSLGSNSYDVHLGDELVVYQEEFLDSRKDNNTKSIKIPDEGILLYPGELYLGSTLEYTETFSHVPFLEGKSSTGRLGISIHATAGKGDIGFKGNWTLEISVIKPVRVYKGQPIAQLIYFTPSDSCLVSYGEKLNCKYQNQPSIPIPSKMFLNNF